MERKGQCGEPKPTAYRKAAGKLRKRLGWGRFDPPQPRE